MTEKKLRNKDLRGRYIVLRYDKKLAKQFFFLFDCLTCISRFSQKSSYARKKIRSVKIAMYIHIKKKTKEIKYRCNHLLYDMFNTVRKIIEHFSLRF